MVLAALMALSDTFYLGMYGSTQRGECPMRNPYHRPSISDLTQWLEKPSEVHHRWDVIQTLIDSFQAEFPLTEDDTSVDLLKIIKTATNTSPVPETYPQYWRQRRGKMIDANETSTADSIAVSTKDLIKATRRAWQAPTPCASQSLIDLEFLTTIEDVQDDPPPAYLQSRFPGSHDEHNRQETDIGRLSQKAPTEDLSQALRQRTAQCSLEGQNQNSIKKGWGRKFLRYLWPWPVSGPRMSRI